MTNVTVTYYPPEFHLDRNDPRVGPLDDKIHLSFDRRAQAQVPDPCFGRLCVTQHGPGDERLEQASEIRAVTGRDGVIRPAREQRIRTKPQEPGGDGGVEQLPLGRHRR